MTVSRGSFVTFEGGVASGKSTQIPRLASYLRDHRQELVLTREPGGTPVAEAIRSLVLSGRLRDWGASAEAVLLSAARVNHVVEVILPALSSGKWVLCDRYVDSMRVYQGVVDGVDAALIRALVRVAADGAWPDLTFILDLPAEVAVRRASSRVRREAERFETDELAIHELRRQAYLEIARQEPERCVVIDAATSEDDVADAIRRIVDLRLLDRAA